MKNIIVYRNRVEVKLLTIICGIVWSILYAVTTIGDLLSQNPVFWHNQKCVWLMGFLFAIPILVVFRNRIIFDYDRRIITKIGYVTPAKRYSFDEITVSVSKAGLPAPRKYAFKINNQEIFQISEIDFEGQTRESVNYLKLLFKGVEKSLYELEQTLEKNGFHVTIYTYSLAPHILSIRGDTYKYWIVVGFKAERGEFSAELWMDATTKDSPYTEKLIEETTMEFDSLECFVLKWANRYLLADK